MDADQTTEVELYFVAFYKHDKPQHVVAGPFLDYSDADLIRERFGKQHVVVKSEPIQLTRTEF